MATVKKKNTSLSSGIRLRLKKKFPKLYAVLAVVFSLGVAALILWGIDSERQRFELVAKSDNFMNVLEDSRETLKKAGQKQYALQESDEGIVIKIIDTRKITQKLIKDLQQDRAEIEAISISTPIGENYRVERRLTIPKTHALKVYDSTIEYYNFQLLILDWLENFDYNYNKDFVLSASDYKKGASDLEAAVSKLELLDISDNTIDHSVRTKALREELDSFQKLSRATNQVLLAERSGAIYDEVVDTIRSGSYEKHIANLYAESIYNSYWKRSL